LRGIAYERLIEIARDSGARQSAASRDGRRRPGLFLESSTPVDCPTASSRTL
jgi:hypothetical protein